MNTPNSSRNPQDCVFRLHSTCKMRRIIHRYDSRSKVESFKIKTNYMKKKSFCETHKNQLTSLRGKRKSLLSSENVLCLSAWRLQFANANNKVWLGVDDHAIKFPYAPRQFNVNSPHIFFMWSNVRRRSHMLFISRFTTKTIPQQIDGDDFHVPIVHPERELSVLVHGVMRPKKLSSEIQNSEFTRKQKSWMETSSYLWILRSRKWDSLMFEQQQQKVHTSEEVCLHKQ